MRARPAAWMFGAAVLTLRLQGATTWVELQNRHFDLYTSLPEAQGREALMRFEEVRQFFLGTSPFPKSLDAPVRVVIFASPEQYDPYRLNNASSAYYLHRKERDYIVLEDLSPDHYRAAVHEYTHLALSRAGVHIPLWMNEGWADLNSTLKPKGRKAMVGDMIAGRREALLRGPWIPLTELGEIDQSSPMYHERDQAGMFYAESWAFVHMLFLAPEYSGKFEAFVRAMIAGQTIADACRNLLGKSVADVQADLQDYLRRNKLYGAVFDIRLNPSLEDPKVTELSRVDADLMLADLLTVTGKTTEARAAYERIEKEAPGRADVETGLMKAALARGDRGEAIEDGRKALDRGTDDAAACFGLAMLSREAGGDRTLTIRALRRAVQLDAGYTAARFQLGIALLESKDYAGSLGELRQIPHVPEEIAAWYFAAEAFDNAKLGDLKQARTDAELGRKWAKTPREKDQIERILGAVEPPKPLQGAATK